MDEKPPCKGYCVRLVPIRNLVVCIVLSRLESVSSDTINKIDRYRRKYTALSIKDSIGLFRKNPLRSLRCLAQKI